MIDLTTLAQRCFQVHPYPRDSTSQWLAFSSPQFGLVCCRIPHRWVARAMRRSTGARGTSSFETAADTRHPGHDRHQSARPARAVSPGPGGGGRPRGCHDDRHHSLPRNWGHYPRMRTTGHAQLSRASAGAPTRNPALRRAAPGRQPPRATRAVRQTGPARRGMTIPE